MQLQRRFLAALQPCGPGTIACEENGIQTEETIFDGKIQELLLVKPENKSERIFRLEVPAFQKEKQFDTILENRRAFFHFSFTVWKFLHFRETVFRGTIIRTVFSHYGKEIVKGAETRCITKGETA